MHRGLAAPVYDFALGIVDELVSYTVKKPRKAATRYYAHANHLYSVAAVTSSTGSVVERWSYNAYGVPTIKNSANATIAKSAVGNDRGFTGYKLDLETGLYAARARMYSSKIGRFISRDSISRKPFSVENYRKTYKSGNWLSPQAMDGYWDGYSMYSGYFIPNHLDPSGNSVASFLCKAACNTAAAAAQASYAIAAIAAAAIAVDVGGLVVVTVGGFTYSAVNFGTGLDPIGDAINVINDAWNQWLGRKWGECLACCNLCDVAMARCLGLIN